LFSASAGGSLKQVLLGRGEQDRVFALFDYLSWGPIGCSLGERIAWYETHSPSEDGWDWLADCVDEFRNAVAEVRDRVIWVAPRNAQEMSGLFWYLHEFGGSGAHMIVADHPLTGGWAGEPPLSLGELPPELVSQLLDGPRQPWDSSRFPADKWDSLMAEDTLLRIVQDGQLRSVPPDIFDDAVVRNCPAEWTRWSRVMGNAMADLMNEGHAVDESFIRWRFFELVASGRLQVDGDLSVRGVGEAAARLRRA
jgi:hypothetical protein